MDIVSYALSKKIAEHAVSGVQSMSINGQTLIINTKDSGVLTMTFPTPKDGVSVADIDVNANNQIVFTMSDGTEFISGKIPTIKGDAGFSPTITENADNTDKIYKLDITTADSTFTTPNLKGGAGGSGEENKIDSISVNGVNIVPDENKNVDITVPTVTNDLTDELKSSYDDAVTAKHTHDNKTVLDNITAEKVKSWDKAEENVQSDWNETDDTADGFIKNKPTIPDAYDDTALSGRIDDVETYIGDMSTIEVKSVSDLVSAINVLYNAFMSSINYANKKLTITYRNGGTVDIDMSAIITDTNIGELSNIDDTGVADKQVLSYDTATNKYIPTTIDTAGVLADAKKYTDDEIAKINNADAISVDEKPTYSDGTITYKKDGVEKTITDGDFWFFYIVDDMAYQTIWIDGVEFTTSVDGSVDFKDFVSKTNDLTSTYTGEETDKTKVTTIASLDALYAIISTALGKKVNTADIVDSLISDATNKPLSAAQGKALDTKISNFITTVEEDYAKTADIPTTLPANGGNADTVNNHTVETDVPVDAVFTDTIYDDTEVKGNIEELNSNLDDLSYGEFSGNDNICDIETNYNFPINIMKVTQVRQVYTKNIPQTSGYFYAYISANLTEYKSGTIAYYIDENDAQKYIGQEHIVNKSYRLPTSIKEFGLLNYGSHEGTISGIMFSETPITSYEPYIPSVKMLSKENAQQNTEAMDLKMLGWTVPKECPIQNYVDNDGVFHQRVGRVDLGSLDWKYETNPNRFNAYFDSVKFVSNITPIVAYSTKYNIYSFNTAIHKDKAIGVYGSNGIASILAVLDSSYTDADTFKSDMKGVYLYYELATPITYTIDGNEVTERINESLDVIGKCKNLLKPTLQTTTQNGVTCTNNGDGTYTLNGTATANTQFEIKARGIISKQIRLVGCPMGGSNTSYNIVVVNYNGSDIRDNGNGITIPTNTECAIRIYVGSSTTLSNKVFKPMLTTNLNVTYDDFVPYTGEGETLTADVAELKNDLETLKLSDVAGGKNILDINKVLEWINKYTNGTYSNDILTISPINNYLFTNPFQFSDVDIDVTLSVESFNFVGGSNARISLLDSNNISVGDIYTDMTSIRAKASRIRIDYSTLPTSITLDKLMLQLGTTATDYEPYIPSVKMLAEEVNQQNESLSDYGLYNKFEGSVTYNYWYNKENGEYQSSGTSATLTNKINCVAGNNVRVMCPSATNVSIVFYNSSNEFISGTDKDGTDVQFIAPTNASYCRINFYKSGGFGGNIGKIGVYINNVIDEIKNDLGDRKMHFLKYTGEANAVIDIANYSDGLYLFTCAYASGNLPKNIFALVMVNNGMAGIVLKDSKDHSISEKKLTFKTDWYSNVFVTKVG